MDTCQHLDEGQLLTTTPTHKDTYPHPLPLMVWAE